MSNNSSELIHEYHLTEGNSLKLVLKYSPSQQSARIYSDGSQRLIFMEKSGFWNDITVLKNEYGVDIGRFYADRWNNHTGLIEAEGKKYHYTLTGKDSKELVVFEKMLSRPLLTCNLDHSAIKDSGVANQPQQQEEHTSLLIGLCWYLFMPTALQPKETADYDLKLSVA